MVGLGWVEEMEKDGKVRAVKGRWRG